MHAHTPHSELRMLVRVCVVYKMSGDSAGFLSLGGLEVSAEWRPLGDINHFANFVYMHTPKRALLMSRAGVCLCYASHHTIADVCYTV